jgi:hypothetical protein
MQHLLKSPRRGARAEIVAPELLQELYIAMHETGAALDLRF